MPECDARFDSTCAYCKQPIVKGKSRIVWVPRLRGSAVHKDCHNQMVAEKKTIEMVLGQGGNDKQSGSHEMQSQAPPPPEDFDFKIDSDGEIKSQDGKSMAREELSKFLREAQQIIDKNSARAMSRLTLSNEQIQKKLEDAAESKMEEAVKKYAQKTIEIIQDGQEPTRIEGAHKNLDELIELISNRPREHAYCWGPPGSGKSTGAQHAAKALSLEYAYVSLNPQTPESRLLGYKDAVGNYQPTPFRKIYEHGGVFCIDELDNASPGLLTTLNGCLENGTAAFPDGMVDAHENFVVVATGNTSGRGGDQFFPERRPFDAAFAERFSFIYWEYDETLERQIALSFNPNADEWIDWVQKVRKYVQTNIIRLTVSPRASIKGAKQARIKPQDPLSLAEKVLFKGLGKDDKQRILSNCGAPPEIKPCLNQE